MPRLLLDHLTIPEATPAELIALATATGCDGVGLLTAPLAPYPETAACDLLADLTARRATIAAARAGGATVDWVYPFYLSPRRPIADDQPRLDLAAELGARGVGVIVYDADAARRTDKLAELAERAAALSLTIALEFIPFTALPDLASARALAAGHANVAISIDALHLARSGGTAADVAALDPTEIAFAQLCDAPHAPPADLLEEAMHHRRIPGEGGLPLADLLRALPVETAIAVEVPTKERGDMLERVRSAVEAARSVIVAR